MLKKKWISLQVGLYSKPRNVVWLFFLQILVVMSWSPRQQQGTDLSMYNLMSGSETYGATEAYSPYLPTGFSPPAQGNVGADVLAAALLSTNTPKLFCSFYCSRTSVSTCRDCTHLPTASAGWHAFFRASCPPGGSGGRPACKAASWRSDASGTIRKSSFIYITPQNATEQFREAASAGAGASDAIARGRCCWRRTGPEQARRAWQRRWQHAREGSGTDREYDRYSKAGSNQ